MPVMVWSHRRHRHAHLAFVPLMALGPLPLIALAGAGLLGIVLVFTAVVTVLAMALSAAVAVGVLAAMGVGTYQLARHAVPWLMGTGTCSGGPRRVLGKARGGRKGRPAFTVETPVDALRRRYAAGEIGQTEFRRGLIELVKERYVSGDLTIDEYESRVRHIMQDPALRPPTSPV
jgi:hypothetical protein